MGKTFKAILKASALLLASLIIVFAFDFYHLKHGNPAVSAGTASGTKAGIQEVYINEVTASNGSLLADEDGDFSDWIELYNPGLAPVNLSGYFLSDDEGEPLKWVFPRGTIIKPGGYLLIWASGKNKTGNQGEIHTNFKISSEGETLILTAPDGNRVIDRTDLPKLSRDVAYGRQPDASHNFVCFSSAETSPGRSNNYVKANVDIIDPGLNPVFSKPGGLYNEAFELTISARPGTVIYYTLDGSVPDENSTRYESPLEIKKEVIKAGFPVHRIKEGISPGFPLSYIGTNPPEADDRMRWRVPEKDIFKGTVVRARAFGPDGNMSEIVTHTYFVDENMDERYTLPVVSLAMDARDLFGFNRGIYIPGKVYEENGYGEDYWGMPNANYYQRGPEWERPVHFEFFEPGGTLGFSINGGVRIHGSASRVLPQKSLRFYARSEYDAQNEINYDIFREASKSGNEEAVYSHKRLILHNGGQEFYKTFFKDIMLQSLIEDADIDTQSYRPVIVFINGEYWGIQSLRKRFDLYYLANEYKAEAESFTILGTTGSLEMGKPGGEAHYRGLLSYAANNDMSDERHYEYVKTLMDVDNYINYTAFQVYIGNFDWPSNNVSIWRHNSDYNPDAPYGLDGRWRWMIFDLDNAFGYKEASYNNLKDLLLTEKEGSEKPDWSTRLFRGLLKNEEFKNKFISCLLTQMHTILESGRIIEKIDYFEEMLLPEIQEHIDRWNGYPRPTVAQWRQTVDKMRDYALERPKHMLMHLSEAFGLEGIPDIDLVISHSGQGIIKVNNIELDADDYPWQGTYFSGLPVELNAVPLPGYRFAGWEGLEGPDKEAENVTIVLTGDLEITALFEKDPGTDSADFHNRNAAPLLLLFPLGAVLAALLIRIKNYGGLGF
ncbi:MAG: CotH kinase family protein [Caldicoprobacterales bacterium]